MDDILHKLLEETRYLSELIEPVDYERFVKLVDLRQSLTDEVSQGVVLTQEQKMQLKQILQYDPIILRHMQSLKDEARLGLNRINGFKKQKSAYNNPDTSVDSFMFDIKN